MKVIFLQDIPNVARAGEIKEVASGYGRNFLIPQKLAVLASAGVARVAEVQRQIENRKQEQTEAELVELGQQLDGREISLNARVGAKDKLFGSITVADITAELKNIGLVVDKRKVELIEPIRRLGSHEITIKLTKDIIPKIKVIVTGEETD